MLKKQQFSGNKGLIRLIAYSAVVLILFLLPVLGLPIYFVHIFIGLFISVLLTSSLRLINLSGQGSLGHAGFMAIGAYTSAILSKNLGWMPWITIVLGALFTFAIAYLVAIPFSRLRVIYFVMITLFFAIAVLATISLFQNITGGESGFGGIPPLFGTSKIPYYYFFLGLLVVCLIIMYRIEVTHIGLTWKAVAQSHLVASSIGINEARQRMLCLAIGGFFAGLAGAGYAHYYLVITPDSVSIMVSIYLFIYMMVGGVNYFSGPIIGTFILVLIPAIFRDLKEFVPYIFAAILLIVLFVMPQGLVGLPRQIWHLITGTRNRNTLNLRKEVVTHDP